MTLHVSQSSDGKGVISLLREGQQPRPICVVSSVEEARRYVQSIEPEYCRLTGFIRADAVDDHLAARDPDSAEEHNPCNFEVAL